MSNLEQNTVNVNKKFSFSDFTKLFSQTIQIKRQQVFYSKNVRRSTKNTIFIVIFILIAFFLSFLIMSLSSGVGIDSYLSQMFSNISTSTNTWVIDASILGIAGLSFLFAHKSGLFNIGISGQMLAGGLAVVGLSKTLTESNSPILSADAGNTGVILSLIVAMASGALVALVTGILKNFFRINEVVSAIMINWIVFYLAKFLITKGSIGAGAGSLAGGNIGNSLEIHSNLSLHDPMGNGMVGAIILLVVLAVIIYVVFRFTTYGKKISSIGKSQSAGVYSGYYTKSLQLSAFVISGAISGVLAVVVFASKDQLNIPSSSVGSSSMVPVEGFNGIAISLVAFSHPILVIPISFLFSLPQVTLESLATGISSLTLSLSMYAVAIFVIIYRIQPINFIKKLLIKKEKCKSSYYVNQYSDDKSNYVNGVRKEIASRNINIFVKKQENQNLNFKSKLNNNLLDILSINEEYFDNIKKLKNNFSESKKSFNTNIITNEGGK